MKTLLLLLAFPLVASAVGEKLPGTAEQRRAYYLRAGYTNGCPVAVSKDGILLSNPGKIRLPVDNDIVATKTARAELAAFKASRTASVSTTNLNLKAK